MRTPLKVAIASVVLLSLAVAAGVIIYYERPTPQPGARYLNIAYTLCVELPFPSVLHEELVEQVVRAFEDWYLEHHGRVMHVNVEFMTPEELLRELETGRPRLDLWWGGVLERFEENRDILLPYNSTVKEELLNLVPNGTYLTCPIMDLEEPTPRWYAWCLYSPCLVYDPEALEEVPRTWEELANPRLENRVVVPNTITDPFSKYTGLVIYASEAWRLGNESLGWERAWNISVVLWALSEVLADFPWEIILQVVAGKWAAVVCPDIVAYYMLLEAGYRGLNMTYLNSTLVFPCPIGVLKGAKHVEEAKDFLDFLLSLEGQSILFNSVAISLKNILTLSNFILSRPGRI